MVRGMNPLHYAIFFPPAIYAKNLVLKKPQSTVYWQISLVIFTCVGLAIQTHTWIVDMAIVTCGLWLAMG